MLGPDVRRQVNVAYGYPPLGPSTLLPATFLRGGQSAPSPLRRLPSRTLASERAVAAALTDHLRPAMHRGFQSRTQQQRWGRLRGAASCVRVPSVAGGAPLMNDQGEPSGANPWQEETRRDRWAGF